MQVNISEIEKSLNLYFELEKAQEMFIRNEVSVDVEMELMAQMIASLDKILHKQIEVSND